MDNVGDLIKHLLKNSNMWGAVKRQEIIVKWPEVVGSKIAKHTEAVKIDKDVLWVKVRDSVWMHHLSLLKPNLKKNVNDYAGGTLIKDVYFFIGDIVKPEEDKQEEQCGTNNFEGWDFSEQEIEQMIGELPPHEEEIKEKIKKILQNNR